MARSSPIDALIRWRAVVAITFVAAIAGAWVLSQVLPTVYSTSSTLLIALRSDNQSFDTVQASQAVARSYADIIDSPNIADDVAQELGPPTTGREIRDATSFEALPETQLLKVNASASTPQRAKRIADTYASVFTRYAGELESTTQASVSLADPAPLVGSPSKPRPRLYLVVAAILGLALGIGLALLSDRLNRRLRTAADVERNFALPVLARIPERGSSEASKRGFAEAHHILRTNLRFARPEQPLRSVAIMSGREGEGKTLTSANLAIAAAEAGDDVIAVEADLRRPKLREELVGGRAPTVGLSEFLLRSENLDSCIVETPHPGLRLLPAGHLPPSPAALLESRGADNFMSNIAEETEFAIFDCPPVGVGADASIIGGWADGVVLVVDLKSSTVQGVREALRQLDAVSASVLGIVVNRDAGAAPTGYGYYAGAHRTRPSATTDGVTRKIRTPSN